MRRTKSVNINFKTHPHKKLFTYFETITHIMVFAAEFTDTLNNATNICVSQNCSDVTVLKMYQFSVFSRFLVRMTFYIKPFHYLTAKSTDI
jgi:hypothetical protein